MYVKIKKYEIFFVFFAFENHFFIKRAKHNYFKGAVIMKKKVLSVILTALMLTACGDKKEEKSDRIIFTTYQNVYDNGMIYTAGLDANRVTRFLDFASLETAPFCAVPNCTHSISSSECLSRVAGDRPFLVGDSVYFFTMNGNITGGEVIETPEGREFYMETKLMKASLDSSETELICEFNDALARSDGGILLIGDMLYFIAYDPDVQFNETGGASWGSGGGYDYLYSVNIKTGEYTNYGSICYVEDEYPAADDSASAQLEGYYDGKLWIGYSFMKEETEIGEDGFPVNNPEFTHYMFSFDPDVKEYVKTDMPYPSVITEEYYTYRDDKTEKINIISGDKTCTTGLEYCETIADNKLFWSDLNGCRWCAIGEETAYILNDEYEGYRVIAFHDGKYVLFNNRKAIKLSEEELIESSNIYEEEQT